MPTSRANPAHDGLSRLHVGHTDNQSLTALLLRILQLRDVMERVHGHRVRVGAAGVLGTPNAVAAAFAMGPPMSSPGR
ncbi:hypothetical protein [Streptomyces silvensis]|uniref:Uncharacterized protein n=1 Tax=Streptomyces silvensis TaxID=1765722 RepID=A0A0W7X7W3_9ACTN|nr:hypothetical protein AT728_07635 [Streptomyces silvensis]